jgi:two-component system cell cycle sensor histidine kinase/response regulator CckA
VDVAPRLSLRLRISLMVLLGVLLALALMAVGLVIESRREVTRFVVRDLRQRNDLIYALVAANQRMIALYRRTENRIIRRHLMHLAEDYLNLCRLAYAAVKQGVWTNRQAQAAVRSVLLAQKIGRKGYPFVIDESYDSSRPIWENLIFPPPILMTVHPTLQGRVMEQFPFVLKGPAEKTVYIEYEWANPGESGSREKAIGRTYFHPWRWAIHASAYKSEFSFLVQPDFYRNNRLNLIRTIASLRVGKKGYAFVIDGRGRVLPHPWLKGAGRISAADVRAILSAPGRRGRMTIRRSGRSELLSWQRFAPYGWTIVTAIPRRESLGVPLATVTWTGLLVSLMVAALFLPLMVLLVNRALITPLRRLAKVTKQVAVGDFHVDTRITRHDDEVAELGRSVAQMAGRLEDMVVRLSQSEMGYKRLYDESHRTSQIYRSLLDASPDPIVVYDMAGHPTYINPSFSRVFGWTLDELRGGPIPFVPSSNRPETEAMIDQVRRGVGFSNRETRRLTKSGQIIDVSISAATYSDPEGQPLGSVVILRDTTEARRLEKQLFQAQKMEAVGTLAGGLAHDFNNLLTGILGNLDLMARTLSPDDPLLKQIRAADKAAIRAADLTGQLLTFGRRAPERFHAVSVAESADETAQILRETIDRRITISTRLADKLPLVLSDEAQLGQLIMNLCLNARDAVLEAIEGRPADYRPEIVIQAETAEVDERYCADHHYARPGNHLKLSVIDNGTGMDAATQAHIFEPFFTTKEVGKGTGLGMAMVYGLVKQMAGWITFESEPEAGSRFDVFLPLAQEQLRAEAEDFSEAELPGGRETVLLVDDEEFVRDLGQAILTELGYRVVLAADGAEALEVYEALGDEIDLVILDLTMPRLSGRQVMAEILKDRPQARIIISSGYSDETRETDLTALGAAAFIPKPYRLEHLARVVRRVLDQARAGT